MRTTSSPAASSISGDSRPGRAVMPHRPARFPVRSPSESVERAEQPPWIQYHIWCHVTVPPHLHKAVSVGGISSRVDVRPMQGVLRYNPTSPMDPGGSPASSSDHHQVSVSSRRGRMVHAPAMRSPNRARGTAASAHRPMQAGGTGHTLQTTALVNEGTRLVDVRRISGRGAGTSSR